MKLPFRERSFPTLVVVPSLIVVIILGVLQYRWSTGVSETTAVRLADSLQMSMVNWQMDLFRYFSEVAVALRANSGPELSGDEEQYVSRFREWQQAAKYPRLVSNVYVIRGASAEEPGVFRLNAATGEFEPTEWPATLNYWRTVGLPKKSEANGNQGDGADAQEIGSPVAGWRFDRAAPALFHVIGPSGTLLAIALDRNEIESHILPDLAHTYFQGTDGLDFLIAVIAQGRPARVMYTSDAGFGDPEPADADGSLDIFGRRQSANVPPAVRVFHMPSDKGTSASVKISWFRLMPGDTENQGWRLVVRHRRGGALGAFVNEIGRRDLAIGLGMMLVLIVNMGMLIVTSHRAARLAELQMNFVTAVSHELRTPLTVILSGADNLRNGVVETKQQIAQYGGVIGNQARQLVGLVERILLFAATRQGRHEYTLAPLNVKDVVDAALADVAALVDAEKFTVETEVAEGLPRVMGDAAALAQCLQNLITNALKYGRDQRWVRIKATVSVKGDEVEIQVSDRGIGISAADLPHIFEPFYRSPSVREAQIHGTGLGLTLSKSIAEEMKGRIEVESAPGRGSSFSLYLPVAPPST